MIRVLHVITNTATGGAEMMLLKLLRQLHSIAVQGKVVSLVGCGPVGERIREFGVPVEALGCRRNALSALAALPRLRSSIIDFRPDVVQTWMYHADLVGGLVSRLSCRAPVVWNIRHSDLDRRVDPVSTFFTAMVSAKLSHLIPRKILANSEAGLRTHQKLGYAARKLQMVPNGFDLSRFGVCQASRASLRRDLGIPSHAKVLGIVGRFHEMKGHRDFLETAGILAAKADIHFVMVGRDVAPGNQVLSEMIKQRKLDERVHLLGERGDVPTLLNAMDVLVSSSLCGEGFSNVLGEAMACGVPCVATDVGDAGLIIGETGRVVPPRRPDLLAAACLELLNLPTSEFNQMKTAARQRVEREFSIEAVTEQYLQVWEEVSGKKIPRTVRAIAA